MRVSCMHIVEIREEWGKRQNPNLISIFLQNNQSSEDRNIQNLRIMKAFQRGIGLASDARLN